jgi:hypothetical protein
MNSRKLMTVATLIAVLAAAGLANAQVALWDQTAGYEGWTMGFFNNIAGSPPFGSTQYTCNDVVVPAGGWTVDVVRVYFDGFDPTWEGAVTEAVLFIEPKTGSTPLNDPATGTTVAATAVVLGNGFLEVSASGLGVALDEGEYWIGLTPFAPNANNIHVSVTAVGDDSPTWDAFGFPMPMWAAWSPGLDGAMLIEGEFGTVANEASSWGATKALYR